MSSRPLRIVIWSTGGVGSLAIKAIARRSDMELVGVWVHSLDKVGRDAGEIAGLAPNGILTTNDGDQLLALKPDCVIYSASGPERDVAAVRDYCRLLSAGVNVVATTTTRAVYPAVLEQTFREPLEAAAKAGGASFYASGIFPGFASDQLPLLLATQSSRIDRICVYELSLNDHYPVAALMMDGLGFGRDLDFVPGIARPGVIATSWRAPIHMIAEGLGWKVDEIRGDVDRRLTQRAIDVAFGRIEAGTCGAVKTRAIGMVGGREAIIVEHIIRMSRDVAPDWPTSQFDATYGVEISGDPDIRCTMTLGDAEGHGAGAAAMLATTMRVLNAVPYVVASEPGLHSSLDMPLTLPRDTLAANVER